MALDSNYAPTSAIYLQVCGDHFYSEASYDIIDSENISLFPSNVTSSDCQYVYDDENLSLANGIYTLHLYDSYGDGWAFTSEDSPGNVTVFDSTDNVLLYLEFPDGSEVSGNFSINNSPSDTNITFEFSGDIADWATILNAEQNETSFTIPTIVGEQNNVSLVVTVPEDTLS